MPCHYILVHWQELASTGNSHVNAVVSVDLRLKQKSFNALDALAHDKTNKMACASSKDSDQLGHLPSLISIFAVH